MAGADAPKKSDLPVRAASAVVMIAVAGTALWLGGLVWTAFVAAVALGVLWEWWGLVRGFKPTTPGRALWMVGGIVYIGIAGAAFVYLRGASSDKLALLMILLGVIATDVGAYFVGRTIGGPKIAPSISPSKTWAGLFGGIAGASLATLLLVWAWASGLCKAINFPVVLRPNTGMFDGPCSNAVLPPVSYLIIQVLVIGAVIAVVAQVGDFFESWMKRRAGVKDSGQTIPGHGGLFDRVDGLMAVAFVLGLVLAPSAMQ